MKSVIELTLCILSIVLFNQCEKDSEIKIRDNNFLNALIEQGVDTNRDGILTILLLLFIVPGIIYLLMSKGKSTLKIDITEEGNIIYFPAGLSIFEKNVVESY